MDPAVSERKGKGETTRLGSFEVVRKLTSGGMAEIFLARTRGPSGFEKLVVLKKILPKYAGRQRYVQLFLEEAKLAATLDHPNIVHVYDIGMVDGSYFFTMEYLHGQDVRSILHRAWRTGVAFPIEDAVQIARHVASALHFAHEKQRDDGSLLAIVHRDVSPSNVIVTYDGATKLLDFGVAKTTTSTVKTRTGTLKGKVAYMSPEQARGAAIDRRSDIFSLGIVLWEMVTTQRLYRADNDLATLQMIIHQPAPSPRTLRPECPPELERIVLRALAEDPKQRYQTAEQLVTDLDELAREHKLKQSPNALAQTLGQLFGAELAAWREARAAGVPLADHLHDVNELTTPVSESDFVELDAGLEDDDDLDDDDLDEEDNEMTEHAAPIVDALPPLRDSGPDLGGAVDVDTVLLRPISGSGIRATPSKPFAKVSGSVAGKPAPQATPSKPFATVPGKPAQGTPSAPLPVASWPVTGTPGALEVRAPILPPTQRATPPPPPPKQAEPAQPAGRASSAVLAALAELPSHVDPADLAEPTEHSARALPPGDAGAPGDPPELAAVDDPESLEQLDTVDAPVRLPSRPPTDGRAGQHTPLPIGGPPPAGPRFAVPPWQSGQPGGPPPGAGERTGRSWAVVSLPPFDPEVFERRQRLVLRVAGGVVAFILLLAIIAGRC